MERVSNWPYLRDTAAEIDKLRWSVCVCRSTSVSSRSHNSFTQKLSSAISVSHECYWYNSVSQSAWTFDIKMSHSHSALGHYALPQSLRTRRTNNETTSLHETDTLNWRMISAIFNIQEYVLSWHCARQWDQSAADRDCDLLLAATSSSAQLSRTLGPGHLL